MRIALGQIDMGFEEKEKAMTLCSRLLAEAKEKQVDFVIFPEMTLAGFTLNPETYGEDRKSSPSMAFFPRGSKENHVAICHGLPVYEKRYCHKSLHHSGRERESACRLCKNSSLLLRRRGKALYRR